MRSHVTLTACLIGLIVLLGATLVSAQQRNVPTPTEGDQLMQRFKALDADGNGNISADEWRAVHGGDRRGAAGQQGRRRQTEAAPAPKAAHDPARIAERLRNLPPEERRKAIEKLPAETRERLMQRQRAQSGKARASVDKAAPRGQKDRAAALQKLRDMTPDQRREAIAKLSPEQREKIGAFLRQRQGGQSPDQGARLRQGLTRLREMSPEERRLTIRNLPPERRQQIVGVLQRLQQRRAQQQGLNPMQGQRGGGRGQYGMPQRRLGGPGGAGQQRPQRGGQWAMPQEGVGPRHMMRQPGMQQHGAPQRGLGGRGGTWQQGPQQGGRWAMPQSVGPRRMMRQPGMQQHGAPQRDLGGRGGAGQQHQQQAAPRRGAGRLGDNQRRRPSLSEQDIDENWDLLMDLDIWR